MVKHSSETNFEQVGGDHYKEFRIQPAVYNQVNRLGFLEGSIIKYASRHKLKNKAEDLKKLIHCAKLLLKIEYGEN